MSEILSMDEMEQFQMDIMSNRNKSRECRVCPCGLEYGPAKADENCHKCAREGRPQRKNG